MAEQVFIICGIALMIVMTLILIAFFVAIVQSLFTKQ
jgi:hypothetical protein